MIAVQSRCEPAGDNRRRGKPHGLDLLAARFYGGSYRSDRVRDARGQGQGSVGRAEAWSRAREEQGAEIGCEIAHAQADGRRREAKLGTRTREALMTDTDFQDTQGFEGWLAHGQAHFKRGLRSSRISLVLSFARKRPYWTDFGGLHERTQVSAFIRYFH